MTWLEIGLSKTRTIAIAALACAACSGNNDDGSAMMQPESTGGSSSIASSNGGSSNGSAAAATGSAADSSSTNGAGPSTGGGASSSAGDGAMSSTGSTGSRDAGPAVTFAEVNAIMTNHQCIYCHPELNVYDNLIINAKYDPCTGRPRIAPGQPDQSLILLKVQDGPPCGARMPQDCDKDAAVGPCLNQSEIQTMRTWIAEGAPND